MAKAQISMKYLIIALVAFIAFYLFWWLYTNFEQTEQEPEPVATAESLRKPYLALSEFLKSKDYSVKDNVSWAELDNINPDDTVVVIPFLPKDLPLFQQQALDKLLDQGHLLVGLIKHPSLSFSDDSDDKHDGEDYYRSQFLDRYNLTLYQDEETYGTSDVLNRNIEFMMPNNWILEEHINEDEYEQWSYFIDSDNNHKLIILPEFSIFTNDNIGYKDHALLFLTFLEVDDKLKKHHNVWLLTAPITPGFFNLIWHHYSEFIVALLLLSLLYIWRKSRRFGPLFPLFKKNRKELKEHLTAVGRWHWNASKSQQLINISFEQINRLMTFSYHHWDSLEPEKQIQILASHTGIPVKNIQATWQQSTVNSRLEFLYLIQQLQTIRIKL